MNKLERVCELLDNQEIDKATELLHEVFVEKSRVIYQQLLEEEDLDLEENFGGSPNRQFINEISDDEEEIENDEFSDDESDEGDDDEDFGGDEEDFEDDDEFGGDEDEFGDEEDLEGEGDEAERIEDLEVALADLRAEFDELMAQEVQEPEHADLGDEGEFGDEEFGAEDEFGGEEDEFGGEDEFEEGYYESAKPKGKRIKESRRSKKRIKEATQLQNSVADPGMKQEGKLAGTGNKSKAGTVDKESPFTHAPSKENYGGNPTKFGDNAGSDGKEVDKSSKKDNGFGAGTNINVKQGNVSDPGMSQEGKFSGTGKNSKAGSTSKESPLTKAPRRRG